MSEREMLHDVEHGKRGNALTVRRKLIHSPPAIRSRDRLHPFGLKAGEVLQRVSSALRLQKLHHGFRELAIIKSVSTMRGDLPQGLAECGIFEGIANAGRTVRAMYVCFHPGWLRTALLTQ